MFRVRLPRFTLFLIRHHRPPRRGPPLGEPGFVPAQASSSDAAALHAGLRATLFVEQLGELFEHDAAQLFGVGDRPLRLGGFPVLLLRGAEEN